jgi:hypothetical protein
MNIDPRGMNFVDWSDRMNLILDPLRIAVRFFEGDNWQDWAAQLVDSPGLPEHNLPMPYQFGNWEEWAMRFNQTIDLPG